MSDVTVLEQSTEVLTKIISNITTDTHLQGCIQCGTCGGVCPFGFAMVFPPTRVISAIRANSLSQVLITDSLWMCVACSFCTTVCPVQIPLTRNLMARLKEEKILQGGVPPELQLALENSQRYGNPLGEAARKRADWVRGIDVPVPILGKDVAQTDVLWFVGDYASYHPEAQRASRALAHLLNLLKIDFAILGNEETSDGDSQRLAGERGLFELLAEKNLKAFQKYRFREMITGDPHAFNALKNEYPALGLSSPVKHSTQFLFERIDLLKPFLRRNVQARIAYHDPCYLGRANGVYKEPRALLQAIPGVNLVEMSHNHQSSLCCGGGGGGMWLDGFIWEKSHVRLPEWRVREALQAKAEVLAVACPYERPRFKDAIKSVPRADGLEVKEICELLMESVDSESEVKK